MNTCEHSRSDCVVVYEGRDCPLCAQIEEMGDLERELRDLHDEITTLKAKLEEAEGG